MLFTDNLLTDAALRGTPERPAFICSLDILDKDDDAAVQAIRAKLVSVYHAGDADSEDRFLTIIGLARADLPADKTFNDFVTEQLAKIDIQDAQRLKKYLAAAKVLQHLTTACSDFRLLGVPSDKDYFKFLSDYSAAADDDAARRAAIKVYLTACKGDQLKFKDATGINEADPAARDRQLTEISQAIDNIVLPAELLAHTQARQLASNDPANQALWDAINQLNGDLVNGIEMNNRLDALQLIMLFDASRNHLNNVKESLLGFGIAFAPDLTLEHLAYCRQQLNNPVTQKQLFKQLFENTLKEGWFADEPSLRRAVLSKNKNDILTALNICSYGFDRLHHALADMMLSDESYQQKAQEQEDKGTKLYNEFVAYLHSPEFKPNEHSLYHLSRALSTDRKWYPDNQLRSCSALVSDSLGKKIMELADEQRIDFIKKIFSLLSPQLHTAVEAYFRFIILQSHSTTGVVADAIAALNSADDLINCIKDYPAAFGLEELEQPFSGTLEMAIRSRSSQIINLAKTARGKLKLNNSSGPINTVGFFEKAQRKIQLDSNVPGRVFELRARLSEMDQLLDDAIEKPAQYELLARLCEFDSSITIEPTVDNKKSLDALLDAVRCEIRASKLRLAKQQQEAAFEEAFITKLNAYINALDADGNAATDSIKQQRLLQIYATNDVDSLVHLLGLQNETSLLNIHGAQIREIIRRRLPDISAGNNKPLLLEQLGCFDKAREAIFTLDNLNVTNQLLNQLARFKEPVPPAMTPQTRLISYRWYTCGSVRAIANSISAAVCALVQKIPGSNQRMAKELVTGLEEVTRCRANELTLEKSILQTSRSYGKKSPFALEQVTVKNLTARGDVSAATGRFIPIALQSESTEANNEFQTGHEYEIDSKQKTNNPKKIHVKKEQDGSLRMREVKIHASTAENKKEEVLAILRRFLACTKEGDEVCIDRLPQGIPPKEIEREIIKYGRRVYRPRDQEPIVAFSSVRRRA